ncbi:class I SAM-dependent methyltransferase [Bacteroidetes/Chlorobi group bacterium ChocPot_Mid]|jgi:ubiquinone/menaquinone biosynthesis C-methylase UbiE|nr:MAG: class I SAM-dependent methyltransferase [Bacteroidetes/Chlorobi group bacterium ChocPot_Mid]
MSSENDEILKNEVHNFWNQSACGTFLVDKEKYTLEYFEDLEKLRYSMQPEIPIFAKFAESEGKKVLEVGVGAGTDFLQWVRSGAIAYGIDLTEEAIEHVKHRLNLYNLKAEQYAVADSEHLPFADNTFDIVYSWGVIHHTPDTQKALHEIVRVCKPNGTIKVMIYHRHSLLAYFFWIKHALLKFRPWKSISWILWNYMESKGTKAFTKKEVIKMLENQPVEIINIHPVLSYYDRLERFNKLFQIISKFASILLGGNKVGWELLIELQKK